jgi:hypothetical protein
MGNAEICIAADMTAIHATVRHLLGRIRVMGKSYVQSTSFHHMTYIIMIKETQLLWDNQA